MPRYIDADKLLESVTKNDFNDWLDYDIFQHLVEEAPTADVVPKSEVERLKDDNKFLQDRRFKELSDVRRETAREIFAEIERLLDDYHSSTHLVGEIAPLAYYDVMLEDAIAELKKKYTEEQV